MNPLLLAKIELWALRSLAVLAVLGWLAWWIYSTGAASVQAKWDAAIVQAKEMVDEQNATNRRLETQRQQRVEDAEATAARAVVDLAAYRRAHPVRGIFVGSVHDCSPSGDTAHPGEGAHDGGKTAGPDAGGVLQPRAAADIGPALELLMGQADAINSAYAVCLSTRP